jgi:hypothetical protein
MTWTLRLRTVALVALAGSLLALVALGLPAQAKAGKETLLRNPAGSCNIGATSGTDSDAFAVINANGSGDVAATVSIKDGAPNATYSVSLVQTPSGENCFAAEATLTTNGQGNGTVHLSEPVLPGQTGAFALVQQQGGFDFRVSKVVPN